MRRIAIRGAGLRPRAVLPALTVLLSLLSAAAADTTAACAAQKPMNRDTMSDTWAATDALGRTLPGSAECGPPKPDRTVGIFYFLWQDRLHDPGKLYDNTRLLAANPAAPAFGPIHAFHWWGEPHLGYYYASDPFVIRRHAQMLADAGVDVVFFDVTNAITYTDTYLALCREYAAIRKAGGKTPQIAFLTNSKSAQTVQKLYDDFYGKNLYPELWFRWKGGKPLLLASEEGLSPEVKEFFTLRRSWAWSNPGGWFGDGKDKWPWLDTHPQAYGWHESKDRPEQISVTVAQHPTTNIGRSFHAGKMPPPAERDPAAGLCFAEQWERALQVDPEFLFITGWNEWIAQRFVAGKGSGQEFMGRRLNEGETFFVDAYDQEYNRDIEPMKGGHGDNYYYQMVAGIRRYKGARPLPKPSAPKSITMGGSFGGWSVVGPEYRDDVEDTLHRDHPGWGDTGRRVNATGRNDFDTLKVARDAKSLYFYARTRAPITAPENGTNWMTLLIDADGDPKTGWEGCEFAVRHAVEGGKLVSRLHRSVGGKWDWQPVATVPMAHAGSEMHLSVPRALLGVPPSKGPLRLRFQWADNVPDSGDVLDFIDKGDAAPNGRFRFRYEE